MGISFSRYILPGRTVRTDHGKNFAADHSEQENKSASNAMPPSEGARKPPVLGNRRWTGRFCRRPGPQLTPREWHGKSSINGAHHINLDLLGAHQAVTALYNACEKKTAMLKGLLADIETVLAAHGAIAEKGDGDFKSLAYAFSRAYKHLFVQHDMRVDGNRSGGTPSVQN